MLAVAADDGARGRRPASAVLAIQTCIAFPTAFAWLVLPPSGIADPLFRPLSVSRPEG